MISVSFLIYSLLLLKIVSEESGPFLQPSAWEEVGPTAQAPAPPTVRKAPWPCPCVFTPRGQAPQEGRMKAPVGSWRLRPRDFTVLLCGGVCELWALGSECDSFPRTLNPPQAFPVARVLRSAEMPKRKWTVVLGFDGGDMKGVRDCKNKKFEKYSPCTQWTLNKH